MALSCRRSRSKIVQANGRRGDDDSSLTDDRWPATRPVTHRPGQVAGQVAAAGGRRARRASRSRRRPRAPARRTRSPATRTRRRVSPSAATTAASPRQGVTDNEIKVSFRSLNEKGFQQTLAAARRRQPHRHARDDQEHRHRARRVLQQALPVLRPQDDRATSTTASARTRPSCSAVAATRPRPTPRRSKVDRRVRRPVGNL